MSEPFAELIAARANDHSGYGTGWRDALRAAAKEQPYAAAPDLYDVAAMLLEANRTAQSPEQFTSKIALVCEYARAATAKARGKSAGEAPKVQAGSPIEASQANQPQE